MPTPTIPQKSHLAAGMAKASNWQEAVALGANKGILINADGGVGSARNQPYLPAKEADHPMVKEGDLGDIDAVDVNPEFTMRYDPGQLGTAIAALFGIAGTPQQQDTTAAWRHTFQWADNNFGKFVTFAVEYPGKILEIATAKVYGLELNIAEGFLKGVLNLRGDTVIDDSTVNQAAQMDALTYIDIENRIKAKHASVKMNAQSGGDVASENALEVSGLNVKYSRSPDAEHVIGDQRIIEPVENESASLATVHLDFPRFNSVNAAFFQDCFKNETEQKMLIAFTGETIESTYKYELFLYFPRLRMTKPLGSWEDVVKSGLDLVAEEAASNPTGMSYKRFYIELQNKQTTDYLA